MKNKKWLTIVLYTIGVLSIIGIIYEIIQMFV